MNDQGFRRGRGQAEERRGAAVFFFFFFIKGNSSRAKLSRKKTHNSAAEFKDERIQKRGIMTQPFLGALKCGREEILMKER